MKVILLIGVSRSGKDTVAHYFFKKIKNVRCIALADQVKIICQRLVKLFYNLDLPLKWFYDQNIKDKEMTNLPLFGQQPFRIRNLMQQIGTDVIRNLIGDNVWVDIVIRQIIEIEKIEQNPPDLFIVTDCRFPNEVSAFKKTFGDQCRSIKITRQNDKSNQTESLHSSESLVDEISSNFQIDNSGSLGSLYQKLDLILDKIHD